MNKIHSALESIAHRDIPEETNLWPQIAARIERKDTVNMNPKLKLAWTVVLVLLGMILATTAAYAVYRYFSDPGLQSVSDAGLFTDVNSTAQPTRLPDFGTTPQPVTVVDTGQTLEGVTITLDWVDVQDFEQKFHILAQGLKPGMRFGMPIVTYMDVVPEQYRGAIFSLDNTPITAGTYVSYQIVRKNETFGGKVDMQIDIPLLQGTGEQSTQLASFHFNLKDVPIIVPLGGGGGNTYAARVNGMEMRLEHTIVTPSYTEARLCYTAPSAGKDWIIQNVTIRFSDQTSLIGEPISMDTYAQIADQENYRCADVRFPQGKSAGNVYFNLVASGLVVRNTDERLDAAWQFNTVLVNDKDLQTASTASVTPTPEATPISKTIGDTTAVLEKAYADARRLVFLVRMDGPKKSYSISNAVLKDADGVEINAGTGGSLPDDTSATKEVDFYPANPLKMGRFKGQLILDIIGGDDRSWTGKVQFDLDLPVYPELVLEPRQAVTINGLTMTLETFKITPSFTILYVCYQKPTLADWGIGRSTTLSVGKDQASLYSYGLLFDSDYGDMGKGAEPDWVAPIQIGRCVNLGFPVGHHNEPELLTLTMPELEQSQPEVIPDAEIKKAQAKLKLQGIEMDYETFSGNGGGGGGPRIKKKPDGMDDEQVFRLFYDALGYYYAGPWVFTVNINP